MIKNYLKIAFRSLLKNKLFSFINVFGLALGMSCSLLIWLWVKDEMSYNSFLPDAPHIYQVMLNASYDGKISTWPNTPSPLQEAIKKDIPEVAYVTKIGFAPDYLFKVGEKSAKENGRYVSDEFFDVFQFPDLDGSARKAIKSPDQIVITRKLAEKYFGKIKVAGQRIQLDNSKYYTVGAVIENMPSTSTIRLNWMVNFKVQEQDWMKRWGNTAFETYVRLKPNTTAQQTVAAMKGIYPRYNDDKNTYPTLQDIRDIHLYSKFENGEAAGGRIEYVRIFSIVAIFILLIACINFMNLATARSAMRAKEVGVRKVVGAMRASLIGQFMSESILTSFAALILALGITMFVLPTFNNVFDKQIILNLLDPALGVAILILIILTGIISGSYPALFLSSLQPVKTLKGGSSAGMQGFKGGSVLRQSLVVFQFAMSVFLIVGMIMVSRQMDFIRNKNLGLDRENVLYLPMEGDLNKKFESYLQELTQLPEVIAAAPVNTLPMNLQSTSGDLSWPGKDPNLQTQVIASTVGYDFVKTMNIKMAAGREFSRAHPGDSTSYLINEAAAKLMGMKDPVDKEIKFWFGNGRIVGVMKDFHMESLHAEIKPLILCFVPMNASYIMVRIRNDKTQEALAGMQRITKEFNPNYPFEYHFADEAYAEMYKSEMQVNTLINYFGLLAIVISCLGLFALATFTAEQRTKEIGIRKVLGASVAGIVALLSKDFLKLVFIALFIAFPIAFWALGKWLATFKYHVGLNSWVFVIAGFLAISIAFVTVSWQSIKAAFMNPVKSLKSE